MGAQSIIMGEAFGKGFQFGKRKISALSNEDFNKLSLAELWKDTSTDVSKLIPSLKEGMTESRELQSFIVKELIAVVKQLPADILQGIAGPEAVPVQPGGPVQIPNNLQIISEIIKGLKNINLNLVGAGNLLPQAEGALAPTQPDTQRFFEPPPNTQQFGPSIPTPTQQEEQNRLNELTSGRDKSQAAHEIRMDSIHRQILTNIANEVNAISSQPNPSLRRRTQSSDLQLKNMILTSSGKLREAINWLNKAKKDYANTKLNRAFLTSHGNALGHYRTIQLQIVRHIKLYR